MSIIHHQFAATISPYFIISDQTGTREGILNNPELSAVLYKSASVFHKYVLG